MSDSIAPFNWMSLPADLKEGAFSANQEPAWPRQQAVRVARWLTRSQFVICGVEIWVPHASGQPEIPTPYVYTWTAPEDLGEEDWPDYVARTNAEGVAFIENFDWDVNDEAYRSRIPFFSMEVYPREERADMLKRTQVRD